jgi:pilus assembly protein CpaC
MGMEAAMRRPTERIDWRPGLARAVVAFAGISLIGLSAPARAVADQADDSASAPRNDPSVISSSTTTTTTTSTTAARPPAGLTNPEPVKVVAGPPTSTFRAGIETPASYLVEVGVSKSKVLDVRYAYSDLMLADAKIADVIPLSNHSFYIVAKNLGATSLSVYGPGKQLQASVNVVVGPDIDGFKARLHDILPGETDISARAANQSLVLSGTASSPATMNQVAQLAETYAPGKVVNMMGVEGTQQVMLSVRFVEMERNTAKNLNVTLSGTRSGNPILFGTVGPGSNFSSSAGAKQPFNVSNTAYGALATIINGDIGLQVDALETKGLVKTLAEPNLVAMSGDTASFLAGGEIPIPVAQAGGTGAAAITIDYKDYGISLAFTPTILHDGLINLVVKPEVSSLDYGAGVTLAGASGTIPGLKVRRANTTVELRDGESFTIAGLLSDTYTNNISQFPFLGDTPVLGALFRSPNYQANKTELVIIVTPHLVTARRARVALPTDRFTAPSDYELFMFGILNGAHGRKAAEDRALMSQDPTKGGVDGAYGHVLY